MKFRKIIPLALLLSGCFLLYAAGRTLTWMFWSGAYARAEVTPSRVDAGAVQIGTPSRCAFVLRNTGGQRLLVRGVKSSCQCSVPELASRALLPGQSLPFEVVINATKVGKTHVQVVMQTNDPRQPNLPFTLEWSAFTARDHSSDQAPSTRLASNLAEGRTGQ